LEFNIVINLNNL